MNSQKYITIYTLVIGILAGILFGFKTTQGFLTGSIESLLYDIGGIFGALTWSLGSALLLAAARYFYLLLKKKPRNFLLNWMQIGTVTSTIFLILVFQLPKTSIDNDQAKEIAGSIQKDLKNSFATGVSEGKRLEGDFGKLTPVVEILNDIRSEVSSIQKEIKTEINQYDFENLFAPENITDPKNIIRLKGNLSTTVSKIKDSIVKYKEIQDGVILKLEQANIDPVQKQQFLNGFEEKRPAADKAFNDFMTNEVATYQQLIDIFTFFEKRQEEFKVIDKMPYFSSETDSTAFNNLIASLQYLGSRRDVFVQKMIGQQSESIEILGKYTR